MNSTLHSFSYSPLWCQEWNPEHHACQAGAPTQTHPQAYMKSLIKSWPWRGIPVTPTLSRLRQGDCKFQASPCYIVNSRPAEATVRSVTPPKTERRSKQGSVSLFCVRVLFCLAESSRMDSGELSVH